MHFLYVLRGSLYETITMFQIFLKKGWLNELAYSKFYFEAEELNKILSALIKSL